MTDKMSENREYDLEKRTAKFGEDIIKFAKKIPQNVITIPLIDQLIKAGASVGANYCEVDDAKSKKDFKHKIGICQKEACESKHWLRMISVAVPELKRKSKKVMARSQRAPSFFQYYHQVT